MINPMISFIVPVYNVEQYLDECIQSVLNQSYRNFEMILVDDGSTDKSGIICDTYLEKDKRIKIFHKANGGLSDARNFGISKATGKYILFLDSDDYIINNSLQEIINIVNEQPMVDVVFLNAIKYFNDKKQIPLSDGYIKSKIKDKTQKEVLQHVATMSKYPGSACTKLIKRDIILKNSIFFEKGRTAEDLDWSMRLFSVAHSYNYCDKDYYCYRQQREGSITSSVTLKKTKDLLYVIEKWIKCSVNREIQQAIYSCAAYEYNILLFMYANLSAYEKRQIRREVNSYAWLLKCRQDKKTKIIRCCYKFLGLEITARLLRVYINIR